MYRQTTFPAGMKTFNTLEMLLWKKWKMFISCRKGQGLSFYQKNAKKYVF